MTKIQTWHLLSQKRTWLSQLAESVNTALVSCENNTKLYYIRQWSIYMCVHLTQCMLPMCQNYSGPYKMLFQLKIIICMSKWQWRWGGEIFVQYVNIYIPEDSGLLGCDAVSLDDCMLQLQRIFNTYITNPRIIHLMTQHHISENLRAHQHCSANHKSCNLDRRCKRIMIHGKSTFHPRTGPKGE